MKGGKSFLGRKQIPLIAGSVYIVNSLTWTSVSFNLNYFCPLPSAVLKLGFYFCCSVAALAVCSLFSVGGILVTECNRFLLLFLRDLRLLS